MECASRRSGSIGERQDRKAGTGLEDSHRSRALLYMYSCTIRRLYMYSRGLSD